MDTDEHRFLRLSLTRWVVGLLVLLSAACGGRSAPEKKATVESKAPVEFFHVDSATAGTIGGQILFLGERPARKVISMDSDAGCEKMHAGHPAYDEAVVVSKDGGLANAVVYIRGGLEGKRFPPADAAVPLDQRGCTFVPRVIAMRAAQPLELRNSDPVAHNIHPVPRSNREWNQEQAPNSAGVEHKFARPEIAIPVRCNVHSWMRAWIAVLDHPYFSVTGADGAFALKNVPPGDYTIAAWHEKLGEQTGTVHLAASGAARVNFSYR